MSFDILIIGGGIAGLSTAYYLSHLNNKKILVLEKENQIGQHASGKNAGMLRQGVRHAELIPFIQETRKILQNPPADWVHQNIFSRTGSILMGEEKILSPIAQGLSSHQIKFETSKLPESLSPQLREILMAHPIRNFLFTPSDGVVDVMGLLENLKNGADAKGVKILTDCSVENLEEIGSGWQVYSTQGKFSASILVNAAGAWATEVGSKINSKFDSLTSCRRHLYQFSPEKIGNRPNWPFVWDIQNEFYFRPREEGWLLCAGDEEKHPAAEPQVDSRIEALLFEKKNRLFSPLKIGLLQKSWACLRTKASNRKFFVDWDPDKKNLFWVAGLGGHGVSVSLSVGRLAARRILDSF